MERCKSVVDISCTLLLTNTIYMLQEGLIMRRTTSDIGAVVAHGTPLISSHSFPSLSDQVLRQLGLWIEEANVEKMFVKLLYFIFRYMLISKKYSVTVVLRLDRNVVTCFLKITRLTFDLQKKEKKTFCLSLEKETLLSLVNFFGQIN